MKKIILLGLAMFSIFVLLPTTTRAVELKKIPAKFKPLTKVGLEFSTDTKNQTIQFLVPGTKQIILKKKFTDKAKIGTQFIKEYGNYFGIKNVQSAKLLKKNIDSSGITHLKYVQQYNNIPVYGGEMILHIKGDNTISAAQGKVAQNLSLSTKPKITAKSAISTATKYAKEKLSINTPTVTKPVLFVYNPSSHDPSAKDKSYLVWVMEVDDVDHGFLHTLFIDAAKGTVVDSMNNVSSIYRIVKDCNDVLGGLCYLENPPAGISVGRKEAGPVADATDVNILYNSLGDSYNYFKDVFNILGPNGRGGAGDGVEVATDTLKAYARYVIPAGEHFYPCPNAYWDGIEFVFCSSTANLPIIGHEFMHAVTQYQGPSPRLSNDHYPGTINEAYSDIFAMAIQQHSLNWEPSWALGLAGQPPLRSIIDPWSTYNPTKLYDSRFSCDPVWDDGGVHRNSTVISYAAYLLSKGGNFNGCTIPAIGLDKVAKIFYSTLTDYLPTNAQFDDLYRNLRLACDEMYGHGSTECNALTVALQAVELDQDLPCPWGTKVEATPVCALPQVDLGQEVVTPIAPTSTNFAQPNTDTSTNYNIPSFSLPVITPIPKVTTPAPTVVVPTGDRKPSFTAEISDDGLSTFTINADFNYYGTYKGCEGPRYFDPIIVTWGQVDSHPALDSKNHFTATHKYTLKNYEYDVTVSIINSCFQRETKRFTVHPKL